MYSPKGKEYLSLKNINFTQYTAYSKGFINKIVTTVNINR